MAAKRSRTGCLTCRQRKLKCDEIRPVCTQCSKANRPCQPSDGLIFRHQQNASMNNMPAGNDGNLPKFFNYADTFRSSQEWLAIPKQLTFVPVQNPYSESRSEEIDPVLTVMSQGSAGGQQTDWDVGAAYRSSTTEVAAHGLEALSAAASRNHYSFVPVSDETPDHTAATVPNIPNYAPYNTEDIPRYTSGSRRNQSPSSTNTSNTPLLNYSTAFSSVIDPSLQASVENVLPISTAQKQKNGGK